MAKIDVGVSVACGYPEYPEITLERLMKAGVKKTELFLNTHSEVEPKYIRSLKNILDSYGGECISLHPFTCGIDTYMLYTGYDRRVKDYVEYHKRYFEAMNILGAKYFILHGSKNAYPDEVICEGYSALNRVAKEFGVTVLQENVGRCVTGDLAQLVAMKKLMGDEVSFCLDIKQALRKEQNPFDFVRELGGSIKHIHFSDHTEDNDCLMPFAGAMDIPKFISEVKAVGFEGCMMIELYKRSYPDWDSLVKSYERLSELCGK